MKLAKKYQAWIPCYSYKIHWSDEDNAFVVSVDELCGCITHGETLEEAFKMSQEAVEGHLEALLASKQEIPVPLSKIEATGKFLVRAEADLHRKLIEKSREEGFKSLNRFVVEKLKEVV